MWQLQSVLLLLLLLLVSLVQRLILAKTEQPVMVAPYSIHCLLLPLVVLLFTTLLLWSRCRSPKCCPRGSAILTMEKRGSIRG
jgi:hypothetical protein